MSETKTMQDLAAAFAGESQANRKYIAYAARADEEGYSSAARLFRAAAEAETIHALSHFKNMGMVGSTAENLKAAIGGETYEADQMYPDFSADIRAEGNDKLAGLLTAIGAVEKIHADLYADALANLGADAPDTAYYVCSVCGHVAKGSVPDECPICKSKAQAYRKVD
jgi:rubrerythrin